MWFNKEHLIEAPDEDFKLVTRKVPFRRFQWQIHVRDSLVASGVGIDDLVDQAPTVIDDLNRLGLTGAAGVLRQLSVLLSDN